MSASFTDNFIADTYTGILHAITAIPSTGKSDIYDGYGNLTALKLGSVGRGAAIDGDLTATSGEIANFVSTNITTSTLDSLTITNTRLTSVDITTSTINASGSITSNAITCTALNSTNLNSSNAIIESLTISSGRLTVGDITNTNLTTSNITAAIGIYAKNITAAVNITTDTLNCRDIGSTGVGWFTALNSTRLTTSSLNAGNVEYPISSTPKNLFDLIYPVGSVYLSVINTNPTTLFAGTTWTSTAAGRFLVGTGTGTDTNNVARGFNAGNNDGGEYEHTLIWEEMARHRHTGLLEQYVGDTTNGSKGKSGNDFSERLAVIENTNVVSLESLPTKSFTGTTNSIVTGQMDMDYTGNSWAHNNTPPSFGVYVWQRTS